MSIIHTTNFQSICTYFAIVWCQKGFGTDSKNQDEEWRMCRGMPGEGVYGPGIALPVFYNSWVRCATHDRTITLGIL